MCACIYVWVLACKYRCLLKLQTLDRPGARVIGSFGHQNSGPTSRPLQEQYLLFTTDITRGVNFLGPFSVLYTACVWMNIFASRIGFFLWFLLKTLSMALTWNTFILKINQLDFLKMSGVIVTFHSHVFF